MDIELRYFDDCPNWQHTRSLVNELVNELGVEATVKTRRVATHQEAVDLDFRGSPTLVIDGEDPFANSDAPVGLACRIYRTERGMSGSPTPDQLRRALLDRIR
jgi:hypothetical protein